jgi:hypothetical protein
MALGSAAVSRIGLVAFGLLASVLLLECGLQVGAAALGATSRGFPTSWGTGKTRVLCIGDSNTYGLWIERDASYPSQLERGWNERFRESPIDVMSLGFPGTNSSRVVRDFRRLVDTRAPGRVILMIGVNDFWTRPFEIGADVQDPGERNVIQRHSLLYKLFHLARRSFDARTLEVEMDPRGQLVAHPDAPGPKNPDAGSRTDIARLWIGETKGAFAAPCHDCTPRIGARGWGTIHPTPVSPP